MQNEGDGPRGPRGSGEGRPPRHGRMGPPGDGMEPSPDGLGGPPGGGRRGNGRPRRREP